jgi:hypothetical protein
MPRARAEARPRYDSPVHTGGVALDNNHQGAGGPDHGRGTATSARPWGPAKAAAALPNDAMKIATRGADKEDHAAAA